MSASGETPPSREDLHAVQVYLNHLAERVETEPRVVAEAVEQALPVLAQWHQTDVFAWGQAIRAQARRLIDDMPAVLVAVTAGLDGLDPTTQVAGQLHLEAGMTLNQFGDPVRAAEHLLAAVETFRTTADDSGQAWALTSLAESYAASGNQVDTLPILEEALRCADRSGDERAARRALKQKAVAYRHIGDVTNAMDAISAALAGAPEGHPKANYLLEFGHIRQMAADFAGAEEAYEAAADLYAEFHDVLGEANTRRALATTALLLGRNREGLRRLNDAERLYRQIDSSSGLAYVLRDRALVLLADGNEEDAGADITEGVERFRQSPDSLGFAGMLRSAARFYTVIGDHDRARAAIVEAEALTDDGRNPLARAGLLALKGEVAADAVDRLAAAQAAAGLYEEMCVRTGQAHALSVAAIAHVELGDPNAATLSLLAAKDALQLARTSVVDPQRRADHDFAHRDVTRNVLTAATELSTPTATKIAADVITDDAPIGLRNALNSRGLAPGVGQVLARAANATDVDGRHPSHMRQHLTAALATLDPAAVPHWPTFTEIADARPRSVTLIFGTPTRDSALPIAWRIPGGDARAVLRPLQNQDVEAIDALGRSLGEGSAEPLWHPDFRQWQYLLTDVLIPLDVQRWLRNVEQPQLTVHLPPVIAHLPLEALLLNDEFLGVIAAIERLPVPTSRPRRAEISQVAAYLDPDLAWGPERSVLPRSTADADHFRAQLGPSQLILVGCHGDTSIRGEGELSSTGGGHVLDAIDILNHDLGGSVVILEACYSGRYLGPRTGDPVTLAAIALLAGASQVIAGLFALPASDHTTGVITATAVSEVLRGTSPPEALRRARLEYLCSPRPSTRVPGTKNGSRMSSDAPWAWAGLVSYST